jgi:hypothetical protein
MKWLAACLVLLLIATLALACKEEEGKETATLTPAATMTAARGAAPSPQMPATPEATPTPELEDEYEGWLTYTNDVYGYELRYPPEATIEEDESLLKVPREEWEQGVTFQDILERYTAKICVHVAYKAGYVLISAPANNGGFRYAMCGRTSRAIEGPSRRETLLIEGETYTASGFEEQGPRETIAYHNETLVVVLEDGTRIEYGARPVETATFEDYLEIRDDLVKIVQSYRRVP